MLTYDEFKSYVEENILRYMPENYRNAQVQLDRVLKNNGVVLDSLKIMDGTPVTPVLYLNHAYEIYRNGDISLEDNVKKLANDYQSAKQSEEVVSYSKKLSNYTYFDEIRDRIEMRVCNLENNTERLAGVPHKVVADLAITYHIVFQSNDRGVTSMIVNNQLFHLYGITLDQLHETAENNLASQDVKFDSLTNILREKLYIDAYEFCGNEQKAREIVQKELEAMEENSMYIVTNQTGINGASCIMSDKVKEMISEKIGGDYYIIPSSIHECLILPKRDELLPEELQAMIQEVNRTQVLPEEKLSDNLYEYDSKEKKFQISEEALEHRMKQEKELEKKQEQKPSMTP